MGRISFVHPKLRPYDEMARKTMTVGVSVLNEIFADCCHDMRVLTKYEDVKRSYDDFHTTFYEDVSLTEYAARFYHRKLSVDNPTNTPSIVLASSILGIDILAWEWDDTGVDVKIQYRDKM